MMAKKLLVADDSLTIQKVIRLALAHEGYEIEAATEGSEAIQKIAIFRPDLVLLDIVLPGKNAFEIKQIINQDESLAFVRFVLMSSAFEKVDQNTCNELVFHGFLTKPFDPAYLRQVLVQVGQNPAKGKPPSPSAVDLQGAAPSRAQNPLADSLPQAAARLAKGEDSFGDPITNPFNAPLHSLFTDVGSSSPALGLSLGEAYSFSSSLPASSRASALPPAAVPLQDAWGPQDLLAPWSPGADEAAQQAQPPQELGAGKAPVAPPTRSAPRTSDGLQAGVGPETRDRLRSALPQVEKSQVTLPFFLTPEPPQSQTALPRQRLPEADTDLLAANQWEESGTGGGSRAPDSRFEVTPDLSRRSLSRDLGQQATLGGDREFTERTASSFQIDPPFDDHHDHDHHHDHHHERDDAKRLAQAAAGEPQARSAHQLDFDQAPGLDVPGAMSARGGGQALSRGSSPAADDQWLAELTMKRLELEDLTWDIHEPMLKPLPKMAGLGPQRQQQEQEQQQQAEEDGQASSASFSGGLKSGLRGGRDDELFLIDQAPDEEPQAKSTTSSPTRATSSRAQAAGGSGAISGVTDAKLEAMVQVAVDQFLAKMAQKTLPDLAEKWIKNEIHRLLSELP